MLRNYIMFLGTVTFAACTQTQASDFFLDDYPNQGFIPSQYTHVLPKYSSLGKGAEYRHILSNNVSWRYEYFGYVSNETGTKKYVVFGLEHVTRSSGLLLDWHPFGGSFRFTGGIMGGKNEFNVNAHYDRSSTLNQQNIKGNDIIGSIHPTQIQALIDYGNAAGYPLEQSQIGQAMQYAAGLTVQVPQTTVVAKDLLQAQARVYYPESAPYFGIGWGNSYHPRTRLRYSVDIGILYYGNPEVDLTLSGPLAEQARYYAPAQYRAYLNEKQQYLEHELKGFRYFPVISAGLCYLF